MATQEINIEKARFDTRLPKEQKAFFERAARLGGYRNLTDFIILTVQQRAQKIIRESEQIIESQKDSEIFFEAISNPQKPNQKLKDAANEYKTLIAE